MLPLAERLRPQTLQDYVGQQHADQAKCQYTNENPYQCFVLSIQSANSLS